MTVNKELFRGKEIEVKAIQAYLSEEQVVADTPIEDKGRTVKVTGEGKPRIRLSVKKSKRYGQQLEMIFFGKRKIEKYKSHEGYAPKTFGYLVLTKKEISFLISALEEVKEKIQ